MEAITLPMRSALRMAYLPGRSKRLVVTLAGIGVQPTEAPRYEFAALASQGGENHVLTIKDPKRCWLNDPVYARELRVCVETIKAHAGITEVVALGNSMGGFMAILLAELTKVDAVIAFTPQFSVHPEVMPEEDRWQGFRKQISKWQYRDVGAMQAEGTRYVIFHGDDAAETRHAVRFPTGPQIGHFVLKDAGPGFVSELKEKGLLANVLRFAVEGRQRRMRMSLFDQPDGRFYPNFRQVEDTAQAA